MATTISDQSNKPSAQTIANRLVRITFWIGIVISIIITAIAAGTRDALCSAIGAWLGSFLLNPLFGPVQHRLALIIQIYLLPRQGCYQSTIQGLRYGIYTVEGHGKPPLEFFLSLLRLLGYLGTVLYLPGTGSKLHRLGQLISTIGLVLVVLVGTLFYNYTDEVFLNLIEVLTKLVFRTDPDYIPVVGFYTHLGSYIYNILKAWYFQLCWIKKRAFGEYKHQHSERPYKWKQLDANTDIRLLYITRKGVFGEYQCDIINTPLETAPAYEAISYTWSNLPKDQKLRVGGRVLAVTQRVIEIIDARASVVGAKLLWIDSICINQADLREKAAQIQRMRDIFNQAKIVISWLGYATDADECVRFMASYDFMLGMKTNEYFMGGQLERARRQAFLNFLGHSYWTRAWILQELVVAQKTTIAYGHNYLSWEFLVRVLIPMHGDVNKFFGDRLYQPNFAAVEGLRQLGMIIVLRITFHVDKKEASLQEILTWSMYNKATDPRDKIYSVLGITSSANEPTITPDYTKNKVQLCIDVARYLSQEHILGLLSQSGLGYGYRDPSLPSWVPNYTGLRRMAPITLVDWPLYKEDYSPTGGASVTYQIHPHLPILTIDCLVFDVISQLGPENQVTTYTSGETVESMTDSMQALLDIDEWIRSKLDPDIYIHTKQKRDEALWRTIVGDRKIDGKPQSYKKPAPPELGEVYARMIQQSNDVISMANANKDAQSAKAMVSKAVASYQEVSGSVESISRGRRIAITKNGALAWVPVGSLEGDPIGAIRGGNSCMVARKEIMPQPALSTGTENTTAAAILGDWRYVGESYVHGFMHGEALRIGTWHEMRLW